MGYWVKLHDLIGMWVEDCGNTKFYKSFRVQGENFSADIYYIQVQGNPFDTRKYVVTADGSVTEQQSFNTQSVTLEGFPYEAIQAKAELADKLYKRNVRKNEYEFFNVLTDC